PLHVGRVVCQPARRRGADELPANLARPRRRGSGLADRLPDPALHGMLLSAAAPASVATYSVGGSTIRSSFRRRMWYSGRSGPARNVLRAPVCGFQKPRPGLAPARASLPSGSATMSRMSDSDIPASRCGSKYLNDLPSQAARPRGMSLVVVRPLANQTRPSEATATAWTEMKSPSAGTMKTGWLQ